MWRFVLLLLTSAAAAQVNPIVVEPIVVEIEERKAMAVLPQPFEDVGICPGEGCSYQEWVAREPTVVRAGRKAGARVLFTIREKERVSALTGVAVTYPRRMRVLKHVRFGKTDAVVSPG